MSESSPSKAGALAKLIVMIVVAGGLVAALLLPFVGGTGLAVRSSADIVNSIPDELTVNVPKGNTVVKAADGSVITEFYEHNRTPVTSDQISPLVKQALIDTEDARFYKHNGVDLQGTTRALVKNLSSGGVQQGGSTLTQQLVKQTLLQSAGNDATAAEAATGDTVGRKLREARYALALEKKYSKDEILTRYLNMVYFGEGAYGIEAASQKYFSVSAKDLNQLQAATLAGLVQSPTDDDPIQHPDAALKRRNQVLERLHNYKHLSDADYASLTAQPVTVAPGQSPPNGCAQASVAGYFCDYLDTYLQQTLKLTENQLDNGGFTIQTTLDTALQKSGDQAVLRVPTDSVFAAVFTSVQPGTGHVLSMSSNRQYGCAASQGIQCESVNLNYIPAKGSGSTYKVFTAAAALTAGYGSHYTITAPQPYTSKVFKDYKKGRVVPYSISNDDSSYKPTYDMTSALVASTNTYYVALEDQLGSVTPGVQISQAMGMHYDNTVTQDSAEKIIKNQFGAFTLGYNATSPLDLANSYATIAASGTRCEPTPVTAITTSDGKPATKDNGSPLYAGDACTPNAIAPGVANTLANMMTGVVSPSGTGRKAQIPGHQIAGKTGTTQGNETAAFAGMTPDYSAAVMYFDPKTKPVAVSGVGGGIPGQIWHDAMAPILTGQPDHPFPAADPTVIAGTKGGGPGAASSTDRSTSDDEGNTSDQAPANADGGAAETSAPAASSTPAAAPTTDATTTGAP